MINPQVLHLTEEESEGGWAQAALTSQSLQVLETPYCQARAGPLCCFLMPFVKGATLLRDKAVHIAPPESTCLLSTGRWLLPLPFAHTDRTPHSTRL